jgi:hypothetical protein
MKRNWIMAAATAAVLVSGGLAAHDRGRNNRFAAELKPIKEVPAVSSVAYGKFKARIDEANQVISYELSYSELEGSVLQAHIHVGQHGVNGGISVFLCGNPPTVPAPPAPTPPACPTPPATVTGTLTPANIVGPNDQGIAPTSDTANEFAELVRAIRSGVTYANVHSSKFRGGEIRGQLKEDDGKGRDRW